MEKKLTKSQRIERNEEIQRLYQTGRYSMAELADRYGLGDKSAVFYILKRMEQKV